MSEQESLQEVLQESLKGLGGTHVEPFQLDPKKSAIYHACIRIVQELRAWETYEKTYTDTMKTHHADIIKTLSLTMSSHNGKTYVSFILPEKE